jgi:two-component system, cell cycle sensor histidine kinase and response regulator CckA
MRPRPYVLVADDDLQMRRLLGSALAEWGYETTVVGSGEAALQTLDDRCPDLLITDLIMPGMKGDELARACVEHCPAVRLVFVSGFEGAKLRELGVSQVVFLDKPVSLATLRSTLARLLPQ